MVFRGEQRENQSPPPEYRGGGRGTIENPLPVKCQSEEGGYGKNLTEP